MKHIITTPYHSSTIVIITTINNNTNTNNNNNNNSNSTNNSSSSNSNMLIWYRLYCQLLLAMPSYKVLLICTIRKNMNMIGLLEHVLHMLSYLQNHHNNTTSSDSNDNDWLIIALEKDILLIIQLFFTYATKDNNDDTKDTDFMKDMIICLSQFVPILIPKLLTILLNNNNRYDAKCREVALECLCLVELFVIPNHSSETSDMGYVA